MSCNLFPYFPSKMQHILLILLLLATDLALSQNALCPAVPLASLLCVALNNELCPPVVLYTGASDGTSTSFACQINRSVTLECNLASPVLTCPGRGTQKPSACISFAGNKAMDVVVRGCRFQKQAVEIETKESVRDSRSR